MKIYWDSSALMEALDSEPLMVRLKTGEHWTRPQALAEIFSTITGGRLGFRQQTNEAAKMISKLAARLNFIELDAPETLRALIQARQLGVRGGRIHDYLHAVAAEKSGADKLLTLDKNDFSDLTKVEIEQV